MAHRVIDTLLVSRTGLPPIETPVYYRHGGLAVTPALRSKGYRVTHAVSGLFISHSKDRDLTFRTIKEAIRACDLIAPLTDWVRPAEEIQGTTELIRAIEIALEWRPLCPTT